MPKQPEAKLWYFEDFLTHVQNEHIFPDRPKDWNRLQVWENGVLKPAMPEGFHGKPDEAQMEYLYSHMQQGTLFLFELGNNAPKQIYYSQSYDVSLNPQKPAPLVRPEFPEIPKPNVPNPDEMENPETLTEEERQKYERQWREYDFAVSEQNRQKGNFSVTEDAYNESLKLYEDNVKRLEELGPDFRKNVEAYNEDRDLQGEAKEREARRKNAPLERIRRNREKADYVIGNMTAPHPVAIPEVFFSQVRTIPGENREVPHEHRGRLHSDATFEYSVYDSIWRHGYDLPNNSKIDAYDAATINFAMIGAVTPMKQFAARMPDIGGPVAIQNTAEQGMYMMVSGMFGEIRKYQLTAEFFRHAMDTGKYAIAYYQDGQPGILGSHLAECVQNIKDSFTCATQSDFFEDMVAATKLTERLLDLFERKPDIWAATELQQKDMDFMRGYVQMGKIYDRYLDAHMKLNEAEALGKQLSTEEKAEILTDAVIRRMVEREFVKDNERVESSDEYNKALTDAMEKDAADREAFEAWRRKLKKDISEDEAREVYKTTNDLDQHISATTRYPVDHKVIDMLGKPGMLERLRETLRKDPAILDLANKEPFEIRGDDLKSSPRINALAERLQPALQNCVYTDNQKHNWFVAMKSMLVRGKVNQDPDAISPWLNSRVASDANRLMVALEDAEGNKSLTPVSQLLEKGLQALSDPDQKTMNLLHNYASDGNLYYYDVGKDMPIRLNAEAEKASFEQLVVPPKPGIWKTIAYYLTFRYAFADEIEFQGKDRDPKTVDLFVRAKAERGEFAKTEDTMRRQAAPRVKITVEQEKLWHNVAKNDKKETENEKEQGKEYEQIHAFQKAPQNGNLVDFPKYTPSQISYRLYNVVNEVSKNQSTYVNKEGNDLARETFTVINSGKASHEKICQIMARAVLLEMVKQEQIADKNVAVGPIEEKLNDPESRKVMINTMLNNPAFKSFVQNTSMDMLKHFFMIGGGRNMALAISDAAVKMQKQQNKENEANAPAVNAENKMEKQGIGLH